MLPVAVQRQLDFGTFRGAKTHLVHEQAVLAVGQLGIAEIQTIFSAKTLRKRLLHTIESYQGGIDGQLLCRDLPPSLPPLSLRPRARALVGQAVGELWPPTIRRSHAVSPPLSAGAKNVGQQKIVRVHKPDVIALSSRQAGVACRDDTAVLLVNHADIVVLRRVLPQNFRAGIHGAVALTQMIS